jgi:hypothetical protein
MVAIVWRKPFDAATQQLLIITTNPHGTITNSNSNLELAGILAHLDVGTHSHFGDYPTFAGLSDNTPAVAWQHMGSTTTTAATAYILHNLLLHQRHYRYH